jgi:tRNA-specific 2-thiouridylase
MARVLLAMSGGVDSSTAAHLLLEQGHEVIGAFMRHGEQSVQACSLKGDVNDSPLLPIYEQRQDHKQGCCSAADAADARKVADRLDLPFYALNFEDEFGDIINYFVDEYTQGRTPNPCVMCNNHLKFGKLFDYADSIDAEFVATGHYARLVHHDTHEPSLLTGIDERKDQSYALFGVKRDYLKRMLLPVGSYSKTQIREIAQSLGLKVHDKKDSQEICFVTSGKHDEFVRSRRGDASTEGNIVSTDGEIIAQHPGIEKFTVGQRKGMGVGGLPEPYFVVEIRAATNEVVVGTKSQLGRRELEADRLNWLVDPPNGSFPCQAKIRYNSRRLPAVATLRGQGRLNIEFEDPVDGIAPGQAVVCYDDDRVLGGGWIL